MTEDENVTEEFRTGLREAIEDSVEHETDWAAFHAKLNRLAASHLAELRRRARAGYSVVTGVEAAWWDYAGRAALAAIPLGLAAALLLLTYLRSGNGTNDAPPLVARVAMAGDADSARAAFESVLTGAAAPQAVMATLIPVPAAAFLAESAGGRAR